MLRVRDYYTESREVLEERVARIGFRIIDFRSVEKGEDYMKPGRTSHCHATMPRQGPYLILERLR